MKCGPFQVLAYALVLTTNGIADEVPSHETVIDSMQRAVGFYRENLSVDGGYASSWSLNPVIGKTEHAEGPTVISIQPHGTTTVGLAMLKAWQATGEQAFLGGAIESGEALARCQLSSGGWESSYDSDPEFVKKVHLRKDLDGEDAEPGKRRHRSTLDDNKSQSALLLLIELSVLAETKNNENIQRAWTFGMESLLAAQRPDGGWPQQFEGPADPGKPILKASYPDDWLREYPKVSYAHLVTLNDGNLYHVMQLLLRAHELMNSEDALASARRLGDFLLRAQMPDPQPGWAQQYSDKMHPSWARKFEPPSISSVESLGAAEALFELWVATGDPKYRSSIEPMLEWLESSRLENGKWARFYEMETNRPLYCDADTYQVTYDDSNLPSHYGFQIEGLDRKIGYMRERLEKTPERLREKQKPATEPEELKKLAISLRGKARNALKTQHADGYWLRDERVDAREFVKQMAVLSEYYWAVKP